MANLEGIIKAHSQELTPRDDVKKNVSEILKRVDNFIRKGELEQAELCVTQAREIDPKNIYAFAFQERITNLKEQAKQNSLAAAACKKAEKAAQTEVVKSQIDAKQPQKEQPKAQPKPQPTPTPQRPPVTAIKSQAPLPPNPANSLKTDKAPIAPKAQPTSAQVTQAPLQASVQQPATAQQKSEEERNIKIQRMIKSAVDAVRKEVELKQMEIRAKEREEFVRREKARIEEAADIARKAEEQRQLGLRKKSEEDLQQKIREALRRKPAEDIQIVPQQAPADAATEKPGTPSQSPTLSQIECSISSERLETLERYKLVLSSVWADGAVSAEEASTFSFANRCRFRSRSTRASRKKCNVTRMWKLSKKLGIPVPLPPKMHPFLLNCASDSKLPTRNIWK